MVRSSRTLRKEDRRGHASLMENESSNSRKGDGHVSPQPTRAKRRKQQMTMTLLHHWYP
jgi:hypothetical protein